jgi:hypothetical protein
MKISIADNLKETCWEIKQEIIDELERLVSNSNLKFDYFNIRASWLQESIETKGGKKVGYCDLEVGKLYGLHPIVTCYRFLANINKNEAENIVIEVEREFYKLVKKYKKQLRAIYGIIILNSIGNDEPELRAAYESSKKYQLRTIFKAIRRLNKISPCNKIGPCDYEIFYDDYEFMGEIDNKLYFRKI